VATDSRRDVTLGIEVQTAGEQNVTALGTALRDLAGDGKALPPAFAEAAAGVDKLTAATTAARAAEAAARAELREQAAALATKRDDLARLKASSDAATRATQEYQQAERALKLALVDGTAALREKKQGLSDASAAARSAATAEAALKSELNAAVAAYRQIGTAATSAGDLQTTANRKVAGSLDQIKGQLDALRNVAGLALGGSIVGSLASDLAHTADAYSNLSARIKLVTGDGAAFNAAFKGVEEVAQRTNTSLQATGELFGRIAAAGKTLGVTNADALRLTETINQALVISGASAESSSAAVTQLLQALQSGVLRGDEFNSVMEQSPRLAKALADGLGLTTSELRKLAEAGQLTATTVIQSLQGQSAALQSEFDKIPLTIGRSIQSLSNAWTVYVGEANSAGGASVTVAKAIGLVASNLDTLGTLLYSAGKAALAYQAVKLAATFLDIGAAARVSAVAVTAQTAAVVANTVAAQANAVAGAQAAASVGRFTALLGTLKLFSFVGIVTNFREIGTAIGEGAAKLMGYDKPLRDLEIATKADAEAARANAAAKAQLAQALQLAADKVLGLTDQSRKLVAEFTDTVAKGGEVSDALGKVSKALELGNLDGIRNAGTALDVLAQRGVLSGAQIRDALAAALSTTDLNVFRINALAAFDKTEQGVRRLQTAIDAIATESLRRAGSSLDELTTGFSKGATSAINDLDALARTLKDLKLTGDDAGRALGTALDKALSAATTERAVKAVIDRFKELGEQGSITGEQLSDGLEKARKKLDDLKPGINSLGEALRAFGLQTREELQATADKLGAAYREIGNSTAVSLAEQRKAFEQWSTAAIAANGGVESSAVKVARTMLEIKEAALGAGVAGAAAGKATAAGFDAAGVAIDAAATSLDRFSAAATKARNASVQSVLGRNTDASGFATDASGNRITASTQGSGPAGSKFDQMLYNRDALYARSTDRGGGFVDPNNPRYWSGGGTTAPAPTGPTATPGSANGGSSHTVTINLGGQAASVNTASAADGARLASLLRQLGTAASRTYP